MTNPKNNFSFVYVRTKNVSCDGLHASSAHPLVYLNVMPKGRKQCPYCGAMYIYEAEKQEKK